MIKKLSFMTFLVTCIFFCHCALGMDEKSYDSFLKNPKPFFETAELEEIFKDVSFSSPIVKITNTTQYKATGDLMIHFNDVSQIESILKKKIDLSAQGNIYYVRDLEPGKEIHYTSDESIEAFEAIHIQGTKPTPGILPLSIGGTLPQISQTILLEEGIDYPELEYNEVQIETLKQQKEMKQLVKVLKNFDPQLFKSRTQDADDLMKVVNERKSEKFSIQGLNPKAIIYSAGKLEIDVIDQITARKLFALIAPDKEKCEALTQNYSASDNHFNLILHEAEQSGFYSIEPFYLMDLHTINSDRSILFIGDFYLGNSGNLKVMTPSTLWLFDGVFRLKGTYTLKVGDTKVKNLSQTTLIEAENNMCEEMYEKLREYAEDYESEDD